MNGAASAAGWRDRPICRVSGRWKASTSLESACSIRVDLTCRSRTAWSPTRRGSSACCPPFATSWDGGQRSWCCRISAGRRACRRPTPRSCPLPPRCGSSCRGLQSASSATAWVTKSTRRSPRSSPAKSWCSRTFATTKARRKTNLPSPRGSRRTPTSMSATPSPPRTGRMPRLRESPTCCRLMPGSR